MHGIIAALTALMSTTVAASHHRPATRAFPHEHLGRTSSWQTWINAEMDDHSCDFSPADVEADAPKFSDFPVEPDRDLKARPPLITRDMRSLRTIIRRGASEGVNFAGHYTFVEFGIGTGRCWVIIDQRTGVVSNDEHGPCDGPGNTQMGNGDQDPQFRLNSRLLILSGAIDRDRVGVAYYVWTGKRLEKLRFYRWDELARCRARQQPQAGH